TIANPPPFDRLRSAATHDHAVRYLVPGLKYRDRTDLAPMMAAWMLRASDETVELARQHAGEVQRHRDQRIATFDGFG
ncbi:hypothetical protein ACC732_37250, partial [Rhizobium ruizarguesonis]